MRSATVKKRPSQSIDYNELPPRHKNKKGKKNPGNLRWNDTRSSYYKQIREKECGDYIIQFFLSWIFQRKLPIVCWRHVGCRIRVNELPTFRFHHSPFGIYKEKILGKRWDKLADGIIYYVPFYKHKYVIGIPGLIDDDFFKEYQRRDSITRNQSIPLDLNSIKNWFNTTREVPHDEFEESQKQQMNEVIKTSRRVRRNHVNGQPCRYR